MNPKFLLILVMLTFGFSVRAQEGVPVYFDYLADNYYLVYPSIDRKSVV